MFSVSMLNFSDLNCRWRLDVCAQIASVFARSLRDGAVDGLAGADPYAA